MQQYKSRIWEILEEKFPDRNIVNISKYKNIYWAVKKYLGENYRKVLTENDYTIVKTSRAPTEDKVISILEENFPDKNLDGLWAKNRNLYHLVRRTFGEHAYRDKLRKLGFTISDYKSSAEETLEDLEKLYPNKVVHALSNHQAVYSRVKKYLRVGDEDLATTLKRHEFDYDPGLKWNRQKVIDELWKEYPDGVIRNFTKRGDLYYATRLHVGEGEKKDYRQELKNEGFAFAREHLSDEIIKEMLEEKYPDGFAEDLPNKCLLRSRINNLYPGKTAEEVIERLGWAFIPKDSPTKGKYGFSDEELLGLAFSTYSENFPDGVVTKITQDNWLYGHLRRRFGNVPNLLHHLGLVYIGYRRPKRKYRMQKGSWPKNARKYAQRIKNTFRGTSEFIDSFCIDFNIKEFECLKFLKNILEGYDEELGISMIKVLNHMAASDRKRDDYFSFFNYSQIVASGLGWDERKMRKYFDDILTISDENWPNILNKAHKRANIEE